MLADGEASRAELAAGIPSAPHTLDDMALDAVGVLDALQIDLVAGKRPPHAHSTVSLVVTFDSHNSSILLTPTFGRPLEGSPVVFLAW